MLPPSRSSHKHEGSFLWLIPRSKRQCHAGAWWARCSGGSQRAPCQCPDPGSPPLRRRCVQNEACVTPKSNSAKNDQFSPVDFKVKTSMSCRGLVGKTLWRVITCSMSMPGSWVIALRRRCVQNESTFSQNINILYFGQICYKITLI